MLSNSLVLNSSFSNNWDISNCGTEHGGNGGI
uniref:Uncharacterized protein n=1 Tax=Arundo donax TaxID=35708 RepID=A0A0A8XWH5_ARUDO